MDNNKMHIIETVSAASAKTSGVATAGVGAAKFMGMTDDEWSIIAIIAGIIGVIVSLAVNILFRWLEHKSQKKHRAAILNLELSKIRKERIK
jgi:hypothetical protein